MSEEIWVGIGNLGPNWTDNSPEGLSEICKPEHSGLPYNFKRLGDFFAMEGIVDFAPIYLNGVLALLCVFVFPGLLFVRAFYIPSFPQRWFVVFLSSLTANHLFVTLIAALHLDPLQTYRIAIAGLAAMLILVTVTDAVRRGRQIERGVSIMLPSDIVWLLLGVATACLAYVNVWKYGVPHIFDDGDVAVSWNVWTLIWAHGQFPDAIGYPQFVPTIWAVTYIFIGSIEQYFAYYIYIVLIIVPLVLNAMILGRKGWWYPLLQGLVFVWFVAEIQESWLRSSLPEAFPDWVVAIFGFCGAVLFIANSPEDRFDREKITAALISLCLVAIAAATKPLFGLLAVAILFGICADAVTHFDRGMRNKICIGATGLLSLFVAAYVTYYFHLPVQGMPNYPVADLSQRLSRAVGLLNSNFTIPFRLLILAGLVLCPFLKRTRWLAVPLWIGFFVWANTASYDLRNILGLVMVSAFIPLFAVARAYAAPIAAPRRSGWRIPDGAVVAALAVMTVGLTLTLALSDKDLKQRFADDQFRGGSGTEVNRAIEKVLLRGCTIFSGTGYIYTIASFERFRGQMYFFFFANPLNEPLIKRFNAPTGCTSFLYSPPITHPSIVAFISAFADAHGLEKVAEGNGMELLVSPQH